MTAPRPPADLTAKGRGRRFWRAVHGEYDFSAGDLELLAETCRILDLVDQLREAADPPVIQATAGPKTNPALVELRHQRIEFRRHLAQLALPDLDDEGGEVQPEVADFRSHRARKAARARWSHGGV